MRPTIMTLPMHTHVLFSGHAFAALGLPETPRAPTQPRLRGRGEDDEADLTPR